MFSVRPKQKPYQENLKIIKPEPVHYEEENGNVMFTERRPSYGMWGGYYPCPVIINKENVLSVSKEMIQAKEIKNVNNVEYSYETTTTSYLVENKQDLEEWTEERIVTYKYSDSSKAWERSSCDVLNEYNRKVTPLAEYFKNKSNLQYKLLESEEDLNEYLSSTLSCDDWCRLKLIRTMKWLNLGDGFITGFADLIGNDLEKYHLMIDLAKEVKDLDILMYMFVYKFGKKEN